MDFSLRRRRRKKEDPISVAAEIIDGNPDLLAEILRRFGAKDVLELKLVSKSWLSLISSPQFCLLHWKHHATKISGLFLVGSYTKQYVRYIPLLPSGLKPIPCDTNYTNGNNSSIGLGERIDLFCGYNIYIQDSSNGFVLLNIANNGHWKQRSYHVYNPTTKKFSTLTLPFSTPTYIPVDSLYLVFDPPWNSHSLHYKIVMLHFEIVPPNNRPTKTCQLYIYSSQTNAWSKPPPPIQDHCAKHFHSPTGLPFDHVTGVFCDGSIHWVRRIRPHNGQYFRIDKEEFGTMPPPPNQHLSKGYLHFGASRGRLHFIQLSPNTTFCIEVSCMETDYSRWTLHCRVDITTMILHLAPSQVPDSFSVLGLIHIGQGESDVFLVLLVRPNMIVSYNIKDNTFKMLDVVPNPDHIVPKNYPRIHPYIEALFPLPV